MRDIDKFSGCLIGGAAGDALGYAIEFCGEDEIFAKYGSEGITEYKLTNGAAQTWRRLDRRGNACHRGLLRCEV